MYFFIQTFEWKCEYVCVYTCTSRVWKNLAMNLKMIKDVAYTLITLICFAYMWNTSKMTLILS